MSKICPASADKYFKLLRNADGIAETGIKGQLDQFFHLQDLISGSEKVLQHSSNTSSGPGLPRVLVSSSQGSIEVHKSSFGAYQDPKSKPGLVEIDLIS